MSFFNLAFCLATKRWINFRALLPCGLNAFIQKHLANLRQSPLLIFSYALKLA